MLEKGELLRDDAAPASMQDVAELVGVSVSTVSRALRGSSSVRQQTRDRVREAALQLGFVPSRSASSLVTGKLNRIAVLIGSPVARWYTGTILDVLYSAIHPAGFDLMLYRVRNGAEREQFFQDLPAQRNADALIVSSFALSAAEHERLEAMRVPTVYLNQQVAGQPSVGIDDVAGARLAVRHLVRLGHRRIAFARNRPVPGFTWSASVRYDGYCQELLSHGLEPDKQLLIEEDGMSCGARVAAALLAISPMPTAVFAENDTLAMDLITALHRTGLRVPEDLSIIGFDGQAQGEAFGLTTIAQPVEELVERAAHIAIQVAHTGPEAVDAVTLPTRLVLRSSTRNITEPEARRKP